MCMGFLPTCMYMHHTYLVPSEARRGWLYPLRPVSLPQCNRKQTNKQKPKQNKTKTQKYIMAKARVINKIDSNYFSAQFKKVVR